MRISKRYETNYDKCIILEKLKHDKILIKFLNTGFVTATTKSHLERKEVKDYLAKSVYNGKRKSCKGYKFRKIEECRD